jgi:hypothetical protein
VYTPVDATARSRLPGSVAPRLDGVAPARILASLTHDTYDGLMLSCIRRPILALGLLACSSSQTTAATTGTATVNGTIDGNTFSAADAGAIVRGSTAVITIANVAGICSTLESDAAERDDSTLTISVLATGGGAVTASSYSIGSGAASLAYGINTPTQSAFGNSQNGTVVLTAVSASHLTGTFDATLASGDHITGSFSAGVCD